MVNIAIDGPSGAGKSTISKLLANKLGFAYIDTGAMYRALALYALNEGISPSDEEKVSQLLDSVTIEFQYLKDNMRVLLNGQDVSLDIRRHEVSKAASDISKIPCVRDKLVDMQRDAASKCDSVLDGRDICSNVLPKAQYKFYLTASETERAKRRYKELRENGQDISFEQVLLDIKDRDKNDMERAYAPLRKTDDAVLIDSTNLSIEQIVELMSGYIK